MTESAPLGCTCKVGRVARRRDIPEVHAELYRRWVSDDGDSLRELARWFGRRVLEAELRAAGEDPRKRDVRRLYDALQADGGDDRVPAALQRPSVSVGGVRGDFVSHQTVHTHLRDCLQAGQGRTDAAVAALGAQRQRTVTTAEQALSAVTEDDAADFDVSVTVSVTCEACGRSTGIDGLLDQGACRCSQG